MNIRLGQKMTGRRLDEKDGINLSFKGEDLMGEGLENLHNFINDSLATRVFPNPSPSSIRVNIKTLPDGSVIGNINSSCLLESASEEEKDFVRYFTRVIKELNMRNSKCQTN